MWSDTSSSASESDTGVGGLISAENDDPTKESRKKRRICRSTLRKSRPSTANSSLGSSAFGSSFGGSPKQSRLSMEQQLEEMPDESEAHDTTSPIPTTTKTSTEPRGYMHHPPPGGWHTLHLDIHQLVHPKQPFIMIDRCRIPAITPSHLSSHNDTNLQSDKENRTESAIRLMTRLPNLTFNMDLQALTSSLGRSVTEVVECKEAIWDYMVQTGQAKSTDGAVYGFGMGVGMSLAGTPGAATAVRSAVAAAPTSNSSTQPSVSSAPVSPRVRPNNIKVHDSIVDRDEFDMWITRYERDMHGRIQMAKALTRRLDWKPRGLSSADHAPSANTHRHAPSASSGARDVISPTNGPPLTVTGTVYVPRPQPGMDITDNHVPSSVGTSTSQPQGFSSSSEEVGTGIAPMTRMDLSSTSLLEEEDAIGGESQPPLNIRQRTGSAPEKMTPNTSVGSKSSTIPQPHAHRHHPGHSRAQSLDAVNAWELLAQENSHLGSFLSGQKPTAADATKSSLERWEDELPKLSRCVKVFVAWNNKTE
ncbi:hypothetical protein FRB91_008350 [Serendipita sp. 411]|nr:hypothetical protein FRB91_008350 [Serendipita sp. 411]